MGQPANFIQSVTSIRLNNRHSIPDMCKEISDRQCNHSGLAPNQSNIINYHSHLEKWTQVVEVCISVMNGAFRQRPLTFLNCGTWTGVKIMLNFITLNITRWTRAKYDYKFLHGFHKLSGSENVCLTRSTKFVIKTGKNTSLKHVIQAFSS